MKDSLFVTCARGLEDILAEELENILRSIASHSNWKYYKFTTDKDISNFLINLSQSILLDK